MAPRHFLDISTLDRDTLRGILDTAHNLKAERNAPLLSGLAKAESYASQSMLKGRVLAMIFEKPSTRTRISFDVAMRQLGGETLLLNKDDLQLGRGETISDTAKVMSRYVDAIMLRTTKHETLEELADNADVPVINGLSDRSHPCQILADLMTIEEAHDGVIAGRTIAWVGDANNVATSFVHAAAKLDFDLRIAAPKSLSPNADLIEWARGEGCTITVTENARQAVAGANCVVTDTWVSMGDKDVDARVAALTPYRVDAALMKVASADAIFLHCLPAYRGKEVTADVIDGPQSRVFDEAENRLHAQKAILTWCLAHDAELT